MCALIKGGVLLCMLLIKGGVFVLQTADRAQRAADSTLVNPAGGEQSKEAAQQLSDANAEIPQALRKGFSDVRF